MPSTFSWVDFEEKDRQKMLEVIKMFQESDTRDELGIGTIRDAFSNMFFPGTTTIQTRVKYMLFIPWIYLRHEKKKTPSREIAQKVWADEVALIRALKNSDNPEGIIGDAAGESLQRMPSSIYWYGLGRWGIRKFHGSSEELHRYLDDYYSAKTNVLLDDDKEPVSGSVRHNWHQGLPPAPAGFPYEASFRLNRVQAEYLTDRIMHQCKDSLLAYLVSNEDQSNSKYIWEHPELSRFPEALQDRINHARNFSLAINGAALLYNLLLAEQRNSDELVERYKQKLEQWVKTMAAINYWSWNQMKFWELVDEAGRIPVPTRRFVSDWLRLACRPTRWHRVADNKDARALIALRERRLKGNRARLENRRALELWTGAAGTSVLSYRWPVAQRMVNDILDGVQEGM